MQDITLHGSITKSSGLTETLTSATREIQFDKDQPIESFVKLLNVLTMFADADWSADGTFYTKNRELVGTFNTEGLYHISAKVEYDNNLFYVSILRTTPTENIVTICSKAYSRMVYSVAAYGEWVYVECKDAVISIPDKFKSMIVKI